MQSVPTQALTLLLTLVLSAPVAHAGESGNPGHEAAMAHLKAGEFKAAAKAYKKLTRADDTDARAWFMLGNVELKRERFASAARAYETALDKGWYASVGGYNLACALARDGEAQAALEALDRAIAGGWTDGAQTAEDPDLASLHEVEGWQDRLDAMDRARNPCKHDEAHRAFDFWVGTWKVFDTQGVQVGTNVITADQNGCVVTEQWSGALGSTGTSVSYMDPHDGQWHQDWVSSTGTVVHFVGEPDEAGAMVLDGTRATPSADARPTRCVWTPQEDGTVTQAFFLPDEAGGWRQSMALTYTRTANGDGTD